ncbi:MAG: FAD-binding oxidoreductase [Oceanospirillaceae bacterium]|nr:FAD-binding oxidoreductase [Oceanospirillaceae bacterium]
MVDIAAQSKESRQAKSVTVIGAGIIGVLIALQLQREGHRVTLIDKDQPGSGCSFGNAGILARSSFAPLSSPSSIKQVPSWLLNPNGPLSICWGYLYKILPWLTRYLMAGFRSDYQQRGEALQQLTDNSVQLYESLCTFADCRELIEKIDYLQVYRSEKGLLKCEADMQWRRALGYSVDRLDAQALQRLEPALAESFKYAHLIRDHGFVKDPKALLSAFYDKFCALGGEFVQAKVKTIEYHQQQCLVFNDKETLYSDKLVVAAGAFSARVISSTGIHIPLETERGYHVNCAQIDAELQVSRPIMDGDLKYFVTPMNHGLRFAGLVEFGGLDAPLNMDRAKTLEKNAQQMLPGLNTQDASYWMGFRPTLADSMPVISHAPDNPNVLYAFGHQHLGLTCAPMTANIVSDLISGRTPAIDISRFDVQRLL